MIEWEIWLAKATEQMAEGLLDLFYLGSLTTWFVARHANY